MRRVRAEYVGRVQGVGFRATARHLARGFAVSGWVRNEADGSVTLEAQGESAEVSGLLLAVRERMGRNIERESVLEIGLVAGERGFEVIG